MANDTIKITSYSPRPAVINGNVAEIPIGIQAKDGYAIVDRDFSWLDKYKWCSSHGYAHSYINGRYVKMHHMIIGKSKNGLDVDHINRNKLDNRLSNLRHVSRSINLRNAGKKCNSKSKYIGINYSRGKWWVRIRIDNIRKNLGGHDSEIKAAKAYNVAALKYYGESACLNKL